MLHTTHIAGGLIIGSLTGEWMAALVGTMVIDVDHLIPIIQTGTIFRPTELIANACKQENAYGHVDQRGALHSFFSWAALSAVLIVISFPFGLTFACAYLLHLTLDAIDDADFFPFFPYKRVNIKGPIGYASWREHVCAIMLFGVFLVITHGGWRLMI